VITGSDAAEIFRPAEAAFDHVAVLVGLLVASDALFVVGFAWDDGLFSVVRGRRETYLCRSLLSLPKGSARSSLMPGEADFASKAAKGSG
jgi:hypothetical protein